MTIELNPITSGYSTGLINDNFQAIEDYVNDKLLQRDGVEAGEVNQMEVDLDMNSHFVYNLPEPVLEHQAARLQDVQNAVAGGAANLITFTPYGSITSENVQGAIQELADSTAQDPNTFEVDTSTGTQQLSVALDSRVNKADLFQEVGLTVNIPTDYATIQEAIDDLSTLSVKQGVIIDLVIETGHQPSTSVFISDGDYSHFQISSVDAEVMLSASFPAGEDFLSGHYASFPILNTLIDANYRCRYGVYCHEASRGYITSGSGVRRAAEIGLHARHGSCVNAGGSIWTDTGTGVNASAILSWSAVVNATGATWSNSAYYGAQAAAGGILNIRSGVGLNCVEYAVRATNAGIVNANGVDTTGSGIGFRSFDGSVINALLSIADNCNVGYFCQHGSILNANDTSAQNCSSAGYQTLNGYIDATGGNANGSAIGFSVLRGGKINAFGSTATGCTTSAVSVQNGGDANVDGPSNFSGCTGARTLEVLTGGKLVARDADLTNSSGVALFVGQADATVSGADFTGTVGNWVEINSGSVARVFSSGLTTGNTNIGSFNAIAGTNGIIWA